VFFGRADFLRWQFASLKRHVRGSWKLVVFDNARLYGRRSESDAVRAICTELGVEWREVRREPALEAAAGHEIFHRRFWSRRLLANPSWSHAYALAWAWRSLANDGSLGGFVGLLDSDVFLARDLDPVRVLAEHELAFVVQHAPEHAYVWPGLALFAGARLPRLREMEWWLTGADARFRDVGAHSEVFLRDHPGARVLPLRPRRLEEAATDIAHAPELLMGPESDEPWAYHFRCGSGWDKASVEISRRKSALILERVAWRDEVAGHPLF
jgi:hypothetical protein